MGMTCTKGRRAQRTKPPAPPHQALAVYAGVDDDPCAEREPSRAVVGRAEINQNMPAEDHPGNPERRYSAHNRRQEVKQKRISRADADVRRSVHVPERATGLRDSSVVQSTTQIKQMKPEPVMTSGIIPRAISSYQRDYNISELISYQSREPVQPIPVRPSKHADMEHEKVKELMELVLQDSYTNNHMRKLLEKVGNNLDQARTMKTRPSKRLRHKSLDGHHQVKRVLTSRMPMYLLCHEEAFQLSGTFKPDMCFLWSSSQATILVVCEVKVAKKGHKGKLHHQCLRALRILGGKSVAVLGFMQIDKKRLEMTMCKGRSSGELLETIRRRCRGPEITVAPEVVS